MSDINEKVPRSKRAGTVYDQWAARFAVCLYSVEIV
jgi:hypothetical protein